MNSASLSIAKCIPSIVSHSIIPLPPILVIICTTKQKTVQVLLAHLEAPVEKEISEVITEGSEIPLQGCSSQRSQRWPNKRFQVSHVYIIPITATRSAAILDVEHQHLQEQLCQNPQQRYVTYTCWCINSDMLSHFSQYYTHRFVRGGLLMEEQYGNGVHQSTHSSVDIITQLTVILILSLTMSLILILLILVLVLVIITILTLVLAIALAIILVIIIIVLVLVLLLK